MDRLDRSTYTPLDFLNWRESNSLELAPKFQRRPVWTLPARSYFIDTLIREMPVPPIYLRVRQSEDKKRIIREVVDGQQRIATVLDYIDGDFSLSKSLDSEYAGKAFSELDSEHQDNIRKASLTCVAFHGVSDEEVLEVFARLNTYSVKLNSQELRNGTYFGPFKQTAYKLAYRHIEFWRRNHIFSDRKIARMLEVEFTSELMIAELDGLQDKKKSIEKFYAEYDDRFPLRVFVTNHFNSVIDEITDALEHSLVTSEFHRPPLFYSLFCAVYHRLFGLRKERLATPKKRLSASNKQELRQAVIRLSDQIQRARQSKAISREYSDFVNACMRQTDNLQPRRTRFNTIYTEAFP